MTAVRRREAGMTLIELLLTIVLLGIVVSAIGVSISVFARTDDTTAARLASSDDAGRLNTWVAADLQSVDISVPISTDEGDAGPCATAMLGTNRFLATLHQTPEGAQVVSYRLVADGDGLALVRSWCSALGEPLETITLARSIEDPGDVEVSFPHGASPPTLIQLRVTSTHDGHEKLIVVDGAPRVTAPPSTLPTTTSTTTTTAPPTTTSTMTTTIAPTCVATGVTPLALTSRGPQNRLSNDSFSVSLTAACNGIALELHVLQNGSRYALTGTTGSPRATGTIPPGQRGGFPTGSYTFEVRRSSSPFTVYGIFTATVNA